MVYKMWLLTVAVLASAMASPYGKDYQSVGDLPHVKVDLRYATTNNFMGENMYGDLKQAFLHKVAREKLKVAAKAVASKHPGHQLLVLDGLRPRSVQRQLWAKVKGTPQESYVANPDRGSIHNYGFAVDLTLVDDQGRELDMGTPYDSFEDLAQPRYEEKFLKEGKLTAVQIERRRWLRQAMTDAGFTPLANEWWHFDALPRAEVKAKYKIVE